MGKRVNTVKSTTPAPRSANSAGRPVITDEEIRKRAYAIYKARGGRPGDEVADWFQARQELEQELLQPA